MGTDNEEVQYVKDINNSIRSRFILSSGAELPLGDFRFDGRTLVLGACPQQPKKGANTVIDVHLEVTPGATIDKYYFSSKDIIEEFADFISFLSYDYAEVIGHVSTCPAVVSVGEQFDIAIEQGFVEKKRNKVDPNAICELGGHVENDGIRELFRFARQAQAAKSPEDKLLRLFTALECYAESVCTETIINKCPQGHEYDSGRKATGNFIRELLGNYGIDKKEFNEIRSLRGKIAHGAGSRDLKFTEKVTEKAARVERAVMELLIKISGISPNSNTNVVITGFPLYIHQVNVGDDAQFEIITSTWEAPMIHNKVSGDDAGASSALAGAPLGNDGRPIIHDWAWPAIRA